MSRMNRTCEVCGASYRYTYGAQRTCGRACGRELRRTQTTVRTCRWCAVPVSVTDSTRTVVTCGPSCSQRPTQPRLVRTCALCHATYGGGGSRYCSTPCAMEAKRQYDRDYNARRPGRVPHHVCGCGTVLPLSRHKCDPCIQITRRNRKRADKRRRRAIALGVATERYTLAEIAQRDKRTCQLCRKRVAMRQVVPHPKAPTVDHVLPLADGGDDTRANVQLAHFMCNSMKREHGTQQLALVG